MLSQSILNAEKSSRADLFEAIQRCVYFEIKKAETMCVTGQAVFAPYDLYTMDN